MKIKDLQTGAVHEYGTNSHDSLYVSMDGRTLSYYNLQNGDGSRLGDYRFVCDDEKVPAESETADARHAEVYFNIGGWHHEGTQGDLISREDLKEKIDDCNHFDSSFQKMTIAEFLTIVNDLIDNTPTVELTEEQAIDRLHETGWLIRHDKEMTERPQGDLISIEEVLKSIEEQYTAHNELVPNWLRIKNQRQEAKT